VSEYQAQCRIACRSGLKYLFATCLLLVSTSSVYSCSCLFPKTSEESFGRAEAVFTGTVVRSGKGEWTVTVQRVWKGDIGPEVLLIDSHARTSCATKYIVGKRYLLLVNVKNADGVTSYSPQVCNWGVQLRSAKVSSSNGTGKWIEDWVLQGRGKGKVPIAKTR